MKQCIKMLALLLSLTMLVGLCACSKKKDEEQTYDKEYIEQTLNCI